MILKKTPFHNVQKLSVYLTSIEPTNPTEYCYCKINVQDVVDGTFLDLFGTIE